MVPCGKSAVGCFFRGFWWSLILGRENKIKKLAGNPSAGPSNY